MLLTTFEGADFQVYPQYTIRKIKYPNFIQLRHHLWSISGVTGTTVLDFFILRNKFLSSSNRRIFSRNNKKNFLLKKSGY